MRTIILLPSQLKILYETLLKVIHAGMGVSGLQDSVRLTSTHDGIQYTLCSAKKLFSTCMRERNRLEENEKQQHTQSKELSIYAYTSYT